MAKVLTRTGSTVQAPAMLYRAVANTVLIYGSESWVVAGAMIKVLEKFYHRVSRQIAGKTDR